MQIFKNTSVTLPQNKLTMLNMARPLYRFCSISLDHIWRFSISFDGITQAILEGRAPLDGQSDCDTRMARGRMMLMVRNIPGL